MNVKNMKLVSILGCVVSSVAGIAAIGMAMKNSRKANQDIDELKEACGDDIKKSDVAKVIFKDYLPTIVLGTISVGGNVCSVVMSRKAEASLLASAALIDQGWRKYKDKVKEVFGIEGNKDILKSIMNDEKKDLKVEKVPGDRLLVWDDHLGFFIADKSKIYYAFEQMNKRLGFVEYWKGYGPDTGVYTLRDFLKDCDGELLDKKRDPFLDFGWDADYVAEVTVSDNAAWVTHNYPHDQEGEKTQYDDNGNEIYVIDWGNIPPVYNPTNWAEYYVSQSISREEYLEGAPEDYEKSMEND